MSELRIKSFCRESRFIDESSCCEGDQTIFEGGVNLGVGDFGKLDPVGHNWGDRLDCSKDSNPFEEIPDSSVVLDDSVLLKDLDTLAEEGKTSENLDEVKKSEKNRRKKDRRKQKKLEDRAGTGENGDCFQKSKNLSF
jgi:hypothetical protein